jgi:hypothetical protein
VGNGRPTIPKASPRTLAVTRVNGSPVWSDVRGTHEGGGGQLWAAEMRPGCNGVAGGWVRAADPAAVWAVSADAGDGESRSGSASRSDSLIEFVKTNVAILPLLILTATTGSDELSYRLNDTAVDGFWIGSNWESTGHARWLTRWLRSRTPLHPTEQLHALKKEG